MAPFIIVVMPIIYYLRVYNDNFFIVLLCTLLSFLIMDFILLLGLFKIKYLEKNSATGSDILMAISVDAVNIFKILLKKVILSYGLFYVFFVGVYLMIKWFLAYPIYVFENIDNPFPKSKKLVTYNSFSVFSILVLGFILYFTAHISLFIIAKQFSYFGIDSKIAIATISGALNILIFPLFVIINAQVYYYLKEHFTERVEPMKLKPLK